MQYKEWWIPTVKQAIYIYPELRARRAEGKQMHITGTYSGMPSGPRYLRGVEDNALRPALAPREEEILVAVEAAVEESMNSATGVDAYNVCAKLFWGTGGGYSLTLLAEDMNMSIRSIQRMRDRFIFMVARHLGYLVQ